MKPAEHDPHLIISITGKGMKDGTNDQERFL